MLCLILNDTNTLYMPKKTINSAQNTKPLLLKAAEEGNIEQVKTQCAHPVNINVKNEQGCTALDLAASKGHVDIVKYLLKKKADLHSRNLLDATPLHGAALNGHFKVVEYLVDQKADIDAKNNDGYTPLHKAAFGTHYSTVQLLLDKGANLHMKDAFGNEPLIYAIAKGCRNVVALLVAKGARLTDQQGVREYANKEMLDFIETIVTKRHIDHDDIKAVILHYAVQEGWVPLAEYLLQQDAHLALIQDKAGNTLLDIAIENGYRELVLLLYGFKGVRKWDNQQCNQWIEKIIDIVSEELEVQSNIELEWETEDEDNASMPLLLNSIRTQYIELVAFLFAKGYDTYTLDIEKCASLKGLNKTDQHIMQGFLARLEKHNTDRVKVAHQFFGDKSLSTAEQDSAELWLDFTPKARFKCYDLIYDPKWNQLPIELFAMVVHCSLQDEMKQLSRIGLDQYCGSTNDAVSYALAEGLSKLLSLGKYRQKDLPRAEQSLQLMK